MDRHDPTEIATTALRAELDQRQIKLHQELTEVATRLEALDDSNERQQRIRMRLRSYWAEYRDNGYYGGFETSARYKPTSYDVTTNDLSLAYLAMLAKQNHPIPDPNIEIKPTSDHLAIYIESAELTDGTVTQRPTELRDSLLDLNDTIMKILVGLREKARAENPYRDIPIAINDDTLQDILLRRVILDYCKQVDPDILIHPAL